MPDLVDLPLSFTAPGRASGIVFRDLHVLDFSNCLVEGDQLVLASFEFRYGLQIFERLYQTLVFLNGHYDLGAIAVLVHYVACAHSFTSPRSL